MLLTGIRTPLGIKLYGNNHQKLEVTAGLIEQELKKFDKTLSVSTDKINSGYYLNINIDEEMLSRYGINKNDVLSTVSLGVAGAKVSTFLDGLETLSYKFKV